MDTLEAIEKRSGCCRKYLDKEIEREAIGTVLNAGRLAPSAGNLQDRSFIVVKNPNTRADIAKAAGNQSWMQTAPVHIVIVAENRKNDKFFGDRGKKVYSIQDTSLAAENMLLAATDLGLGCSLIVGFNEELLNKLLDIKEPAQPLAIIVLGHSAEETKPSSKYPLDRFVFFEKYGSKVENMTATFGEYTKVKEQMVAKKEEIEEKATGFFSKIKSFFKKKKEEEIPVEEHFLEKEQKEETPRQIPKK